MTDRDLGTPQRHSNSRKPLLLAGGAFMVGLAMACGGGSGKDTKSNGAGIGLDVSSNTPAIKPTEVPAVLVVPTVVPTPTVEAPKVALSADKGLVQMVQAKLKPQFAQVDMSGVAAKNNPEKKSNSKTKEVGRLGTDPNQLNYSFEEGLDGKAFGWSFTVDQAGMDANDIKTAMAILANFAKEVPDAANGSWKMQKSGTTTAYEMVKENPDGSFDSVMALVVPGVNPGKWVYRTGFCHVTSADPNRASNSCIGLQ